jgi:superkiller protein 3
VALCESGNYNEAIKHYSKAIDLDKRYQDPLSNIAVAFTMVGKLDDAIGALKHAINLSPHYPEAYNNLGSVYIDKKDLAQAEKALRTAISLRSYYGKAYFNLARVCEARGDFQGVFDNLKKATEGDLDTVAEAHLKLGLAAFKLEKNDIALQAFARVIRLDPTSESGYFNYGNALYLTKNYEQAVAVFDKLVAKAPNDYRYIHNLAESHFALNEFDKALPLYERLTKFESCQAQEIFRIVACHEKMKNYGKAKEFLSGLPLHGAPAEFSKYVEQEMARFELQDQLSKTGGVKLADMKKFIDVQETSVQKKSAQKTSVKV